MTTEAENMFIDRIDCNLPYHDKAACLSLIDEASTLSINAMFSLIEEICRIPSSDKDGIETDFLIDLLTQTKIKFNHALKEMVLETACK
ncbi:MAG TPA: hypothetical protein VHZ50_01980, partial [Puia sp.]|nr:hypothetical protein [Puia sp.]